jgi:hypothetical protein
MTSNQDYWAHVSAAFVGSAIAWALAALTAVVAVTVAQRVRDKRAERNEARARDEHNTKVENGDERSFREQIEPFTRDTEQVDEGKLRVAVQRSVEDPEVAARRRCGAGRRRARSRSSARRCCA